MPDRSMTGGAALLCMMIISATAGAQTVIDHTCADLQSVPQAWIETVQDEIPSHYAHTSHGSQLNWGLQFIQDSNPFYAFETGSSYLPSVSGEWCIFDGQETATYITPDLYWETGSGMDMTRAVLDDNPQIRTSMWCWCTQLDYYGENQVQAYLDSMSVLESEYPGVVFIYFTGNAQGTGSDGYNRWQRNQQIRDYCISEGKVLFDFADLDCWWYNPASSSWEQHTYQYNGYDVPSEHPEFYGDEYGHTTAESCIQKGEALWYMMAVIAGWQGTGIAAPPDEGQQARFSVESPSWGYASVSYTLPCPSDVRVSVYSVGGRLVESAFRGNLAAGSGTISAGCFPTGLYIIRIKYGEENLTRKFVVL